MCDKGVSFDIVAADVEIRYRAATDLTGCQAIEYAPVQLI